MNSKVFSPYRFRTKTEVYKHFRQTYKHFEQCFEHTKAELLYMNISQISRKENHFTLPQKEKSPVKQQILQGNYIILSELSYRLQQEKLFLHTQQKNRHF